MQTEENTSTPDKAEEYLNQANNWDIDQVKRTKDSEQRAWFIALTFMALTLISVISIMFMMPLKQLEYLVIRIDDVTGVVDVQRTTLKDAKETYTEATDKYWIRRYVRIREGWLFDEYERSYKEVGLLSAPQEQQKWFNYYMATNPSSPYNLYSNKAKVQINIRSVVMIGKKLANVHYTKTVLANNTPSGTTYWVATVPYRYVDAPLSELDREMNPIGFQVLDGYRIDPVSSITTQESVGIK